MQDRLARQLIVFIIPLACSNTSGSTVASTDIATSSGTKEETSAIASEPTSATSSMPTSGSETTSPASTCGDGHVDPSESCDDGNQTNGDGCNVDCRPTGEQVWEFRSGTPDADAINDVTVTLAGDILVCGYSSPQDADRWVAMFDKTGGELWSKTYNQPGYETLLGIASTPTTAYVVGSVASGADGHDIWVGGVDPADGTIKWQDTFSSGLGDDYATGVALIPGGDAVAVGLTSTEGGRIWARRYAQGGEPEWTNTYSTFAPLFSVGPDVAVHGDQLVIGATDQSAPPLLPELLFAVPLTGGLESWSRSLPDTNGIILGIAASEDKLVVTGRANFEDLIVRRLSPAGDTVAWSSLECVGSTGRAVAIDSQGDIVVIGDGLGNIGSNIRLCKFSADGQLRWGKDIDGGFGDDRGFAVRITGSDQIVATGSMSDAQGIPDAWMAVFSP